MTNYNVTIDWTVFKFIESVVYPLVKTVGQLLERERSCEYHGLSEPNHPRPPTAAQIHGRLVSISFLWGNEPFERLSTSRNILFTKSAVVYIAQNSYNRFVQKVEE